MAVETDRASLCTEEQLALEQVVRQLEHSMKTGLHAADAQIGRRPGYGRDQHVAPPPVDAAHGAHVRVEVARLDQLCERKLVEHPANRSTTLRISAAGPSIQGGSESQPRRT